MDTSRLLLTIIKKTKTKQAFQVNDVNAFLHMARYKSLSSLKLFLWYASLILGPCYLVFSILNPLRVQHQVPMASWLATFIVYQSVRQHFSSARTNFHHFSNIKIFASLVFFRIFVSFSFFKKLYSSSLSTVQWKFYFHFLYWFSLKFIRVFPLYFSEQLKKEIGKFYDFLKKICFQINVFLISSHSPLTYCCLSFAFLWISNYLFHFLWLLNSSHIKSLNSLPYFLFFLFYLPFDSHSFTIKLVKKIGAMKGISLRRMWLFPFNRKFPLTLIFPHVLWDGVPIF